MVLDAHAERVHQDGDHDPPVEVLAVHDPLQLVPEAAPQQHQPVLGFVRVPVAPPAAPASSRPQLRPLVGGRYAALIRSQSPNRCVHGLNADILHGATENKSSFGLFSVWDSSCELYVLFFRSSLLYFRLFPPRFLRRLSEERFLLPSETSTELSLSMSLLFGDCLLN